MGMLAKALSPPSSHAAKKTDAWAVLMDRIEGCMFEGQLAELEAHLATRPNDYPYAWRESIAEVIEKKRDALASEDLSSIMREKYDF